MGTASFLLVLLCKKENTHFNAWLCPRVWERDLNHGTYIQHLLPLHRDHKPALKL